MKVFLKSILNYILISLCFILIVLSKKLNLQESSGHYDVPDCIGVIGSNLEPLYRMTREDHFKSESLTRNVRDLSAFLYTALLHHMEYGTKIIILGDRLTYDLIRKLPYPSPIDVLKNTTYIDQENGIDMSDNYNDIRKHEDYSKAKKRGHRSQNLGKAANAKSYRNTASTRKTKSQINTDKPRNTKRSSIHWFLELDNLNNLTSKYPPPSTVPDESNFYWKALHPDEKVENPVPPPRVQKRLRSELGLRDVLSYRGDVATRALNPIPKEIRDKHRNVYFIDAAEDDLETEEDFYKSETPLCKDIMILEADTTVLDVFAVNKKPKLSVIGLKPSSFNTQAIWTRDRKFGERFKKLHWENPLLGDDKTFMQYLWNIDQRNAADKSDPYKIAVAMAKHSYFDLMPHYVDYLAINPLIREYAVQDKFAPLPQNVQFDMNQVLETFGLAGLFREFRIETDEGDLNFGKLLFKTGYSHRGDSIGDKDAFASTGFQRMMEKHCATVEKCILPSVNFEDVFGLIYFDRIETLQNNTGNLPFREFDENDSVNPRHIGVADYYNSEYNVEVDEQRTDALKVMTRERPELLKFIKDVEASVSFLPDSGNGWTGQISPSTKMPLQSVHYRFHRQDNNKHVTLKFLHLLRRAEKFNELGVIMSHALSRKYTEKFDKVAEALVGNDREAIKKLKKEHEIEDVNDNQANTGKSKSLDEHLVRVIRIIREHNFHVPLTTDSDVFYSRAKNYNEISPHTPAVLRDSGRDAVPFCSIKFEKKRENYRPPYNFTLEHLFSPGGKQMLKAIMSEKSRYFAEKKDRSWTVNLVDENGELSNIQPDERLDVLKEFYEIFYGSDDLKFFNSQWVWRYLIHYFIAKLWPENRKLDEDETYINFDGFLFLPYGDAYLSDTDNDGGKLVIRRDPFHQNSVLFRYVFDYDLNIGKFKVKRMASDEKVELRLEKEASDTKSKYPRSYIKMSNFRGEWEAPYLMYDSRAPTDEMWSH